MLKLDIFLSALANGLMTGAVYALIALVDERKGAPNQTDVVSLDAQVLGVDTVAADLMASVRFSGMLREQPGTPAEAFDEVWNFTRPTAGQGGWVLAGIQQLSKA